MVEGFGRAAVYSGAYFYLRHRLTDPALNAANSSSSASSSASSSGSTSIFSNSVADSVNGSSNQALSVRDAAAIGAVTAALAAVVSYPMQVCTHERCDTMHWSWFTLAGNSCIWRSLLNQSILITLACASCLGCISRSLPTAHSARLPACPHCPLPARSQVVRSRMHVHEPARFPSLSQSLVRTAVHEGYPGLYRGFAVSMVGTAAYFALDAVLHRALLRATPPDAVATASVSISASASASGASTAPFPPSIASAASLPSGSSASSASSSTSSSAASSASIAIPPWSFAQQQRIDLITGTPLAGNASAATLALAGGIGTMAIQVRLRFLRECRWISIACTCPRRDAFRFVFHCEFVSSL